MTVAKELYRELKTPTVKRAKKLWKGDEVWTGSEWIVVTNVDYNPSWNGSDRKMVEVDFDGAGISERYEWKTRLIVR